MAFCTDCGSSIADGALHCPSCGAKQPEKGSVMPRLDLNREQSSTQYRRMESFPPLFETEQPKKRIKAVPAGRSKRTADPDKVRAVRKVLLIAAIVVIIAAGALAGVYTLLPQIKSSDEAPVIFLSGTELYLTRGSGEEDNCFVMDMGAQLRGVEDRERALEELEQSIYFDKEEETVYFLDFESSLISVRINRLRSGKDISDRVKVVAQHVMRRAPDRTEDSIVGRGYTVLGDERGVVYISSEDSSLRHVKDGKDKTVAENVDRYTVSDGHSSVMYLCRNAAVSVHSQYTMYIRSLTSDKDLVKVDSKVSTVEHIKGEFELLWYTRYDEDNAAGPISVWVGGRNIEKEQVLSGLWSCESFTDGGFYYSVMENRRFLAADYVVDVSEDDPEYEEYATVRSVLSRTEADCDLQTVCYWSESGGQTISENVVSWKVLDAAGGLVELTVCDHSKIEKLDITQLKSAYTAVEYLSDAEALGELSYSCMNGPAFSSDGLEVACVSDDTVYLIDSEDASLYSASPARSGFGSLSRVAGDVFAAAWWPEHDCLVFVRDYNESTGLCDLYAQYGDKITQLSYNVIIPEGELMLSGDGLTLLYLCRSESEGYGASADLYVWDPDSSGLAAQNVTDHAAVDGDRLFYITEDEQKVSVLRCTGRKVSDLARDVSFVCAPGSDRSIELELILRK